MKRNLLYPLLFIFVLALASAVFCFPQFFNKGIDWVNSQTKWGIPHMSEKQFNLGLDVKGGVRLEYQADLSKVPEGDRASVMEGVRDLIETRINRYGVAEPQIQISGEDRLVVELPGVENIDQAIAWIGQTPWLNFSERRPQAEIDAIIAKAKELEGKSPEEMVKVENYQLAFESPYTETELTGKYLSKATFTFDQNTGKPIVQLKFNDEGAKLFADITGRNVGQPIAILLDGLSIIDTNGDGQIDAGDMYAPNVEEKISGGSAIISGSSLTVKDARTIAQRLNEGALPVPLGQPITQQKIGPTLGAVSFDQTVMAGIWGFLMVVAFMVFYYRLPGLLASLALALYGVVLLAIFKLMGVTMSLAGIGGFILSVGMAVDANVLIFSRLKEELGAGKSLATGIEEGFRRAWPAIRDGNFTTIVVAFILFFLGTSFVKGFAATLIWGILLSMYSAIIVTRTFLRLAESTRLGKIAWLWKPLA